MEDYEQIIAHLRNEIKSRDKDIRLAATYGKQLFEEKIELSQKIENFLQQKELLEQDKHSLQLELEAQIQNVNTQTTELELERSQTDNFLKRLQIAAKENEVLNKRIQNLIKENQYLKNAQEDVSNENKSLREKISLQEIQIKNFENNAEKSIYEVEGEGYQQLQAQLNTYIDNNKELQEGLCKMQYEVEMAKKNESYLIQMVKNLEEGIKERDSELSAYSVEVSKYKEDIDELHAEIEILKFNQVDTKRRGNSVFAELDDRRTLVEREYKLLQKKFEHFKKNYEVNKQELDLVRGELAILRNTVSREYQQAYIDKLEEELAFAKKDIQELIYKLDKALKNNNEINYDELKLSQGNEYDYLRVMLKQSQERVKEFENETVTLRMKNCHINYKLAETEKFLYQTRQNLDSMQQELHKLKRDFKETTENVILRVGLEKMQLEKDTEKPNVEVLDGFKPPPSTKMLNKLEVTQIFNSTIIPGELELDDDGFRQVKPPRKSNRFVLQEFNKRDEVEDDEKSNENCHILASEAEEIPATDIMGKSIVQNSNNNLVSKCEIAVDCTTIKETVTEGDVGNLNNKHRNHSKSSHKKNDYCAQQ